MKAKAGLQHTRRYDLGLHCVLYAFMFLNAPMFRFLWIRELHRVRVECKWAELALDITVG